MTENPPSFLGLANSELDDADVAIISAPFEGSVSYGKGTSKGPAAILAASAHLESFDEELAWDLGEHLKFCVLPPVEVDENERIEAYVNRLKRNCAGYGLGPPFPLSLGGEHSVTAPILAGVRKAFGDVTVVQIDAHADLRDEYHGSQHNHACAMRRVLDLGIQRLVAIGIRSAEAHEFAMSRDDPRIDTHYAHELQSPESWREMLDDLEAIEGPVYLTVDIDGLDLSCCPSTGTPQPGGLSWYQATEILRALILHRSAPLIGADVTETVPHPGSQVNEMVAAKLIFKILSYRFFAEKTGASAED